MAVNILRLVFQGSFELYRHEILADVPDTRKAAISVVIGTMHGQS